jgi:hypothetical protein
VWGIYPRFLSGAVHSYTAHHYHQPTTLTLSQTGGPKHFQSIRCSISAACVNLRVEGRQHPLEEQ